MEVDKPGFLTTTKSNSLLDIAPLKPCKASIATFPPTAFNTSAKGTLNGKTFKQLQTEFYENNPYLTSDIEDRILAVQNKVDPEYRKNIVIRNGVRYLVNPKTKEVRILPDPN